MSSFLASTLLAIIPLLSLISATPNPQAPSFPAYAHASNLKLVANVTAFDLTPSIHGWEVTSYDEAPCESYAVLTEPGQGRPFYVNGTGVDVRFNQANVLTDGSSSSSSVDAPFGMIVPAAGEDNTSDVAIFCGPGTAGVGIARFPDPVPRLVYGRGKFYGCHAEFLLGPAIQVLYRGDEITPAGCAELSLLAECVEDGVGHAFGVETNCYPDVSALTW